MYVLSTYFVPHLEEDFLQGIHFTTINAAMHVVPFTHYLCTFYIIVGNVHATCIGDLSVDDYNLSVITVEHSMYPWEFHRFIFINFDAHIAYFFEVLLSERLIVGSISETIIECPYLDTFLDFLAKQIKKKSGNTIVSEVEVFQVYAMFGLSDSLEHIIKFLLTAHQKCNRIIVRKADAFPAKLIYDQ